MCLYPAIDVWLCGQAQNGANLDCQVKFDLEGQDRPLHKTIGNLTNVFCIFDPNVVNLARMGYELSRGQASDWHTPRQTDRQTDRQTHTHAVNGNTRRSKLASDKKGSYAMTSSWARQPYLDKAKAAFGFRPHRHNGFTNTRRKLVRCGDRVST